MLTEATRQRLEALNRGPLDQNTTSTHRAPRRRLDDLPGGEVCLTASGAHYRVCSPLAALARGTIDLASPPSGTSSSSTHAELAALAEHWPCGIVFLDLETCGFSGSAVFLVGMVRFDGQALIVDQLLARNPAEERAVLESFWTIAAKCRVLVSFNGKSFDWSMLRDRTIRHRMPTKVAPEVHCDILHHARRRWKGKLADCRLETLERFICRRCRSGDMPGAEVPAAYQRFVRGFGKAEMLAILRHNALDLLTLVQLGHKLAG